MPNFFLHAIFHNPLYRWPTIISILMCFFIIILTPIMLSRTADAELKIVVSNEAPKLLEIFNLENSVFGYAKLNCSNIWFLIFLFVLIFIVTVAVFIMPALNIFLYHLIKKRTSGMNKKSVKIQIMMYKTLIAQQASFKSQKHTWT